MQLFKLQKFFSTTDNVYIFLKYVQYKFHMHAELLKKLPKF